MKKIKSVNCNYIEITGVIKFETKKAVLFYDGSKEVWIPKSQLEDIDYQENSVIITVPEWLAIDKRLV